VSVLSNCERPLWHAAVVTTRAEVDAQLAELGHGLGEELRSVADVQRQDFGSHRAVRVMPRRAGCAPVAWTYAGFLQVDVGSGHGGGRFESDGYETADADFIEAVVLAAVDGRVAETFIGKRSKVTVTLDDGSVINESGGPSLPWPWLRRRSIQYQPYRPTS
jgi:hypothetical protein